MPSITASQRTRTNGSSPSSGEKYAKTHSISAYNSLGDPKPLSDVPIDVLEHFAEFASSMLHSRTTPHSKAFAQAMNEWVTKNEKT
jgi:hypothetical protein